MSENRLPLLARLSGIDKSSKRPKFTVSTGTALAKFEMIQSPQIEFLCEVFSICLTMVRLYSTVCTTLSFNQCFGSGFRGRLDPGA